MTQSTKKDLTVLVLGATGRQGGAVALQLLNAGYSVRILTRKPEGVVAAKFKELGAQVVQGDLDDEKSVDTALTGAWGAFSVFTPFEKGTQWEEKRGKLFAQKARGRGVSQFVYSSVASADKNTGIPHFESKKRTEDTIRELGFQRYTIIRPVSFMENYLNPQAIESLGRGKFISPIPPDVKTQMIAVEDIGKFALLAFDGRTGMNSTEIDIAGDSRTMPEAAGIFGKALGRDIKYEQMDLAVLKAQNADYAAMMEWMIKTGYSVDIEALEVRYPIKLQTLEQWAANVKWPKFAEA